MDLSDRRTQAGLLLSGNAHTWPHTIHGAYRIPSRSRAGLSHTATEDTCTCEDNSRGHICAHRRAVQIYHALREIVSCG